MLISMRLLVVMVAVFALVAWDLSSNGGRGLSRIEAFGSDILEQLDPR